MVNTLVKKCVCEFVLVGVVISYLKERIVDDSSYEN